MDNSIIEVFKEYLDDNFIEAMISNSSNKDEVLKIKIRLVLIKDELLFQTSEYKGQKIFHTNYKKEELLNQFPLWFNGLFKQVQVQTKTKQITILISKKGRATIKIKNAPNESIKTELDHNRKKNYILEEGILVPFLVDLGVMTKDGAIVKTKNDKFKQINRFLEFIEDILPSLDKDKELTIIDFGCGKSYLTFAMYYYLKELKNYKINIIGLDLKEDVIEKCNSLKDKYGYENLVFLNGDIASFEGVEKVDMVVTLHACDVATDYALYKAIHWGADVILSVPCCQHELNSQIHCTELNSVLKYGLIKERMSALFTDGIRANLLETQGYKTQLLEFVDMEHTPKNILIRAVKSKNDQKVNMNEIDKLMGMLSVKPTLYQLLNKEME